MRSAESHSSVLCVEEEVVCGPYCDVAFKSLRLPCCSILEEGTRSLFELQVIMTLMFDLPVEGDNAESAGGWMDDMRNIVTAVRSVFIQKETAGPG